MTISDQYGRQAAMGVTITTVDPNTRRIEGVLKDGGIVQIAVWDTPALFAWPKPDEHWTVTRQGQYWRLGNRVESTDEDISVSDLDLTQAKLDATRVFLRDGSEVATTNLYAARVESSGQSIPASTPTTLSFPTVAYTRGTVQRYDEDSLLTAGQGGIYVIGATVHWPVLAAGFMAISIQVNGTAVATENRQSTPSSVLTHQVTVTTECGLYAGDSVRVIAFHTDTVARAITTPTAFWLRYIGP